jgi:hypothetical protein
MTKSSEFGGDASAVAANTPTSTIPAAAPATAAAAPVSQPAAPAPAPLGTGPGSGNDVKIPSLTAADVSQAVAAAVEPLNKQIATLTAAQSSNSATTAAQTAATTAISNQNALQLLSSTLSGYGIENAATGPTISNALLAMNQNNYDASTIQALIEDPSSASSTDTNVNALATAWNTRFAGNVTRIANGQTPLSPADYIATENSYRQITQAAGLPVGFYDTPSQMAKLIGASIAPTELQDRVNTAAKSIANQDPFYTATLQNYYGLSPSDMIAHALDPATALPLLQRQTAAATFGAAGARQNVSVDQTTANQYAALGITQSQAEQGFQSVAAALPTEQKLAAIYGGANTQFGTAGQQQANLTAATFGGEGGATAEQQLKKLQQQEVNAFSGSSGVDKNSLFGSTAGTF